MAALVALALVGCTTPDEYTAQADAEVGPLLQQVQDEVSSVRDSTVQQPAPAKEPEPAPAAPPAAEPTPQQPAPAAPEQAPPEPGAAEAPHTESHATEPAAAAQEAPAPAAPGALSADQSPRSEGRATEAEMTAPLDSSAPDALHLDLKTSLATAVTSGRDYNNHKESLYLDGLSLTLTRYNFGPLLNGTVASIWNDSENGPGSINTTTNFGVSQILDSGGTLTAGANLGALTTTGGSTLWNSGVNVDLTQPLLRGSGYLVSHEALTQAERTIVYQVRDFELFREDFAISVAQDFFNLIRQRQRIKTNEQAWRDAVFDRRKTEAMRQVDRAGDQDLFLARRQEIDAENTLLESRTDYKSALDVFKLTLGLPASTEVVVVDEEPPFESVKLDEESAVSVALNNRLDLMTAREQVEDTERSVIIARDALQSDLALTAGAGFTGADGNFGGALPDAWQAHAGLTLDLPLNRQAERNAWRASLIALDRARRDLQLQFDEVERTVRNQLRQLKQAEQQIELEKEHISQEQRSVAVTQIKYDAGALGSRDLLEARKSLTDAQNSLIDLLATHVVARLTLMRTLGTLFLNEQGSWMR
jgi:outer membrane protein TolC